jgi:hypothetical protein
MAMVVHPMYAAAVPWAVVCVVLAVWQWRDRARWKAHERQMAAGQARVKRLRVIEDRLRLESLP